MGRHHGRSSTRATTSPATSIDNYDAHALEVNADAVAYFGFTYAASTEGVNGEAKVPEPASRPRLARSTRLPGRWVATTTVTTTSASASDPDLEVTRQGVVDDDVHHPFALPESAGTGDHTDAVAGIRRRYSSSSSSAWISSRASRKMITASRISKIADARAWEVEVEVTQLGLLRDVANEVPDATLLVVGQAEVLEDVVQDVAQGEPGLLLRGGEDVSDGRDPVVLAVLKDVDDLCEQPC